MKKNLILHSGPPITWTGCVDQPAALSLEALIYEGIAKDVTDAEKIASSGEIDICAMS